MPPRGMTHSSYSPATPVCGDQRPRQWVGLTQLRVSDLLNKIQAPKSHFRTVCLEQKTTLLYRMGNKIVRIIDLQSNQRPQPINYKVRITDTHLRLFHYLLTTADFFTLKHVQVDPFPLKEVFPPEWLANGGVISTTQGFGRVRANFRGHLLFGWEDL
eukprot:1143251-Pelagomonas_calceolata.AAC.1